MTTATVITDRQTPAALDWNDVPLRGLIDHIVNKHHVFLRAHLPKIQMRFERILAKAPDDICGFIPSLAQTFFALKEELENHLLKEEQILFPYVVRLEAAREAGEPAPAFHCGSVMGPIRQMEYEHASGKRALKEMRRLTGGYPVREGMCEGRQGLFEDLLALEADLLEHIRLENDILHPRAARLEAAR